MAASSWTEPVIAGDGTVYAIDGGRGLVAFTPTGVLKWATPLYASSDAAPAAPTMLAVGSDSTAYALYDGQAYAFAQDGTSRSGYPGQFCDGKGFEVGPNDLLDVFGDACLDQGQTGVVVTGPDQTDFFWSTHLAFSNVSPPSYGRGDALYFLGIQSDGTTGLFALATSRWTVQWSAPADIVPDAFDASLAWPIVRIDGSVVFADSAGLHAVDASGAPLWTVSSARQADALASGPDGTVYAGDASGGLLAVGPAGKALWQWDGPNVPIHRPIVDGNGTVYVGTSEGIAAIASDGMELWETSAAATPLAIDAAGGLYALDATGQVLTLLR